MGAASGIASDSGDQWNQFSRFLLDKDDRYLDREYRDRQEAMQRQSFDLQRLMAQVEANKALSQQRDQQQIRGIMARGTPNTTGSGAVYQPMQPPSSGQV